MALHLWFTFFLAYLATTATPGPNVLLVVRNALRHGPAAMGATLVGNLTAQLLVVTGVALGVGALLVAMPSAFLALKILGASYLIYLGVRQLFGSNVAANTPVAAVPGSPVAKWRIAGEAFLVSVSNPKAMIFLCAFLPQFLQADRSVPVQFIVMYLTIAAVVISVHSVYCYTAFRFSKRLSAAYWVALIKRISGALFIGLGLRLLSARAV
ncbi:LysE family translocator [Phytopseudomonas punonensis]|uniref:Threonine/homoserine/homoserine lactone efflux protein n=1 Tax=Phytopseudomonas punonensis TaxID=1220495 RepID=A0A1M7GC54_9GAMM|nr:LysE family translocator [Pseudomonas punonensis]SHM13766.1 Threonine/homoserine/homoserine lactone efflux protein [Pseudomonas punonensis]